jgi:hypothetical protein
VNEANGERLRGSHFHYLSRNSSEIRRTYGHLSDIFVAARAFFLFQPNLRHNMNELATFQDVLQSSTKLTERRVIPNWS